MAKYIHSGNFARRVCNFQGIDEHSANAVVHLLYIEPTADVVEVKHGEWKDKYGEKYHNKLYVCSLCGEKALWGLYMNDLYQTKERQILSDYCPHCGAKMDGEDVTDNAD